MFNHKIPHNIQDENWGLFTKVPMNPEGERNAALGDKVSTNILDTIDNSIFKIPFLAQWHKIYTLYEISHTQVDWDTLKASTKTSFTTSQMGDNTSFQRTTDQKTNGNKSSMDHTRIPQELWAYLWRRHSHIPVSQIRQNLEKYQKGPSQLGRTKQNCAQHNLIYFTRNLTLLQRTPHMSQPYPLQWTTPSKQQTSIGWLQVLIGLISNYWAEMQNSYLQ